MNNRVKDKRIRTIEAQSRNHFFDHDDNYIKVQL